MAGIGVVAFDVADGLELDTMNLGLELSIADATAPYGVWHSVPTGEELFYSAEYIVYSNTEEIKELQSFLDAKLKSATSTP